jgi:hypothetical protein
MAQGPPYRWPTDPPGKKPSHSISYEQHLNNASKAQQERQRQQNAERQAAAQKGGAQVPILPQGVPQKGTPTPISPTGDGNTQTGGPMAGGNVGPMAVPAPGGPAGPGAPAPPPAWAPDSGYNDAVGLARRKYEAAIGQADTDERTTKFEFGFDDPTNPWSRVNEAKRQFLNRGAAITGGLGARGHLYSGVHQARRDSNRRLEDQNMAGMRAQYQARLDALAARRTGAKTTQEEDELRARLESMARQGVN